MQGAIHGDPAHLLTQGDLLDWAGQYGFSEQGAQPLGAAPPRAAEQIRLHEHCPAGSAAEAALLQDKPNGLVAVDLVSLTLNAAIVHALRERATAWAGPFRRVIGGLHFNAVAFVLPL